MARLMSHFANALANAKARRSPCLARMSVKLTTVVTLATTTSFKALVGAQAKRDIKPIFIIDFLIYTHSRFAAALSSYSHKPVHILFHTLSQLARSTVAHAVALEPNQRAPETINARRLEKWAGLIAYALDRSCFGS